MPQLLEPGKRYAVCLDSDKDKPQETRPVFWVLAVSARDAIAGVELVQSFTKDAEIVDHLKTLLVGWDNLDIDFDLEKLPDVLTVSECYELYGKINRNEHLNMEEKKSSESPV